MHQIPFEQITFTPESIPGNAESEHPVTFEISAAGGADRARLKSILLASHGLAGTGWTAEVQDMVIAAFRTGSAVFTNTVDRISNLTVPQALAKRAGLTAENINGNGAVPFMITTGRQFAAIAGYSPALAFEVALKIMAISQDAAKIVGDGRFFVSPSTSPASSGKPNGSAKAARKPRKKTATADASPKTAPSQKVM